MDSYGGMNKPRGVSIGDNWDPLVKNTVMINLSV